MSDVMAVSDVTGYVLAFVTGLVAGALGLYAALCVALAPPRFTRPHRWPR